MIASLPLRDSDFSLPRNCLATCWVIVEPPCAKSPAVRLAHTARPMPFQYSPPW